MGTNEWGYLGKPGNKWYENVGYSFGALTNLQDVFAGFYGSNYTYNYEKSGKGVGHAALSKGTPEEALLDEYLNPDKIVISVSNKYNYSDNTFDFVRYANNSDKTGGAFFGTGKGGVNDPIDPLISSKGYRLPLCNVAEGRINIMSANNAAGKRLWGIGKLKFGWGFGCSSQAARALWRVGIPTLPINFLGPGALYMQLGLRQMGIFASPYLTTH